jgi:hypothetical protein
VPGFLAAMPGNGSHGLCEPCMGHHYGYED